MNKQEIEEFFSTNVKFNDWEFFIGNKGEAMFLQIRFQAKDNYSGKEEIQFCRKWQLSEWMTPTELVETAWAAVQRAIIHEAAEQFLYRGADIFNRHMSVEKLHMLRTHPYALEHRAPPKPELTPPKMKIIVMQRHINNGQTCSPTACPIGLAIKERTGGEVNVSSDSVVIAIPGYLPVNRKLPRMAQDFIDAFDGEAPVEPFEFELECV